MIKLIAFELWDILLEKQGKDIIKEIIKVFNVEDKIVFRRKFLELYHTKNWGSKAQAYKEICDDNKIPSTEDNIARMTNIANKNMQSIVVLQHTKELLDTLKKSGLKLGLVSNSSNFSINLAKEHTKILDLFDYNVFSYDINTIKPDPKMFSTLINISNCEPNEILYIGNDKKENLAAKSLGINTILYKDYEQLKKDLVAFGILL